MSPSKVVLVCLSLATLVAATAAAAARGPMEDGTLTVRDGRGQLTLKVRGSLIGRLNRGKITVSTSTGTTTAVVRGWESRNFSAQGTVYTGANIRFRVADDRRVTVKLNGKGLNFSAVGRGEAFIDGIGNPSAGIFFDGTYSLNGEAYKSLPDDRTRIELRAPSPPPPQAAPVRG
ncbi:MAG TPA: hypothetical protein VNB86_06945 [Gaiellaceae bacterium]|nr:hypothetical protein [Gaiellaceae bacterium]